MKRNVGKLLFTALTLVLMLIVVGCQQDSGGSTNSNGDKGSTTNDSGSKDAKVIKYAHFQPGSLDQPKQAAAVAFKSYVEQQTNGSIEVEIYPASQLGDEQTVIEGLEMGSIQMAVMHDGPISSIYPESGVFNLPFLFNSLGEAWSIYDSEYTKNLFDDMLDKTGIRVMALADNGIRHFTNSTREIRSPDDMKDLKIRVQPSPLYEKFVDATGASPSAVSWPELPAALQQGVVDGQENGVTNILAASLYETQDFVTLDGHVYSYHAYMISDEFFSSLTDDEQKAIEEAIDIVKWIHRGMTADQDMNAGTILAEQGMTVTELTPEEIEVFRETTQPVIAEWMRDEFGAKWVDDLLEEVEKLR